MPKKTLIITGPDMAKEINPMGETVEDALPKGSNDGSWNNIIEQYREVESSLKEYRITKVHNMFYRHLEYPSIMTSIAMVGEKVKCEVNEETLEAIIL